MKAAAAMAAVVWLAAQAGWGAVLNVPQRNQEKDQWCWCASSQMVLLYYGKSYSQTAIANWAVGGRNVPNFIYGSDSTRKGVDLVLRQFGGLSSSGLGYAMSLATLTSEMAASRPAVIRWGWNDGSGHILVAHGVSGSTVYLRDPWPANGPTVNSYTWVRSGSGHTWTHSLKLNTSPNPYYAKYVAYMNAANAAWRRYQSSHSAPDLADYYLNYAYAGYYYYLHQGQAARANQHYYYYRAHYYKVGADYYFAWYRATGRNIYAAYGYYYLAYAYYYYYLSQGNSAAARYYYNLFMAYAQWYYTH